MHDAVAFAQEQGIPLKVIATGEMDNPEYRQNDASRCFHCKGELFTVMEQFRAENGFDVIAYGVNSDDQGDYRPGQKAARQHGVAAPLLDAGLTKQEIRDLSRAAGLRIWPAPSWFRFRNRNHWQTVTLVRNVGTSFAPHGFYERGKVRPRRR